MDDAELAKAPELDKIRKHLAAAEAELSKLRARSGRNLAIYVEGEAGPGVLESDRDEAITDKRGGPSRSSPVDRGGSNVRNFALRGYWAAISW